MTHKCVQNSFLRELDVTFLLLIVIEIENCGKVKVQRRWVKHFDANFVVCFGKSLENQDFVYLFKTVKILEETDTKLLVLFLIFRKTKSLLKFTTLRLLFDTSFDRNDSMFLRHWNVSIYCLPSNALPHVVT